MLVSVLETTTDFRGRVGGRGTAGRCGQSRGCVTSAWSALRSVSGPGWERRCPPARGYVEGDGAGGAGRRIRRRVAAQGSPGPLCNVRGPVGVALHGREQGESELRWCAIVAVALAVQGCGTQVCTLEARHVVTAEVWDWDTGGQLIATPRGILTDGSFREEMTVALRDGRHVLTGGRERHGTYDVEVRAAGYQAWRMKGVKVEDDGCHVITAELDASMVRLTPP